MHGGDRLPWAAREGGLDNFAPLASLDWQVHVYGGAPQALRDFCTARPLALHEFVFDEAAAAAGLARDALYLVRPDGYVALASTEASAGVLDAYLRRASI